MPIIAKWWYSEWGNRNNRSYDLFKKWAQDHCNIKTLPIAITLEVENEIIGVACIRKHELEKSFLNLSPWIGGLFVKKDKRKQGNGSFLMKEIEKVCSGLDYKHAYLFTPDQDKLYQKSGWTEYTQINVEKRHLIVMKKEFKS